MYVLISFFYCKKSKEVAYLGRDKHFVMKMVSEPYLGYMCVLNSKTNVGKLKNGAFAI